MVISRAEDLDSMLAMYPKAAQAASNTDAYWNQLLKEKGLSFPPVRLYMRVFKEEKEMEIWASNGTEPFTLIKTYEVCMIPGQLGPKIRQGDKQVPEGFYFIDTLNPDSEFHLSMRINYPNAADLIRSKDEKDPGGDIYIHGDCYSVGCLPMQDEPIEEIFWLVAKHQAFFPGNKIDVHIFPFRMETDRLNDEANKWKSFWQQLKPEYDYFNLTFKLPAVSVDENGHYNPEY